MLDVGRAGLTYLVFGETIQDIELNMTTTTIKVNVSRATNRYDNYTRFHQIRVRGEQASVTIEAEYEPQYRDVGTRACGLSLTREDAQQLLAALQTALETN